MKLPLLKLKSIFLFLEWNLQTAWNPNLVFFPLVCFQIVVARLSQIFQSLEFKWFTLNSECWYYDLFHDDENTLKMKKKDVCDRSAKMSGNNDLCILNSNRSPCLYFNCICWLSTYIPPPNTLELCLTHRAHLLRVSSLMCIFISFSD